MGESTIVNVALRPLLHLVWIPRAGVGQKVPPAYRDAEMSMANIRQVYRARIEYRPPSEEGAEAYHSLRSDPASGQGAFCGIPSQTRSVKIMTGEDKQHIT